MRSGALTAALLLFLLAVPGAGSHAAEGADSAAPTIRSAGFARAPSESTGRAAWSRLATISKPQAGGTVVVLEPFGPTYGPWCLGPVPPCVPEFFEPFPSNEPIVGQVLEGAFEVAPDLTYRPNLVSRATVTKRPFTVTYHIRRDARWADGPPITARDFVFTHKLLLFVEGLRRDGGRGPEDPLWQVRAVRALDAKTVKVTFKSPVAAWRELFHRVYPRHALAISGAGTVRPDLRTVWNDGIVNPKTGRPTGSGPFIIQRWERRQQIVLVRNRHWKPRRPYLDRIVYRFPPDLPPNPYLAGVDLYATYRNIPRVPGHETRATPGPAWEHIAVQLGPNGHPALKNRLVRRALAFGIDRSALLNQLSFGRFTRPLQNGILLTNSRFYERHWHVYRYRPAEARRLLERAGCIRGSDGIYVCAGRRLSLRLTARGFGSHGASEIERAGIPILQGQLRTIGVELVPVFSLADRFFSTVLPGGDFDLALFSRVSRADPGTAVEVWRCGGGTNVTGYCNRQVSRELLRSRTVVDQKARMELLNRVDSLLARDVPFIPLYQQPLFVSHVPGLRGVVNNPWEGFTWNSEDWRLRR
jgi:peptide/nickel transport system substrate-binding protein